MSAMENDIYGDDDDDDLEAELMRLTQENQVEMKAKSRPAKVESSGKQGIFWLLL